MRKQINPRNNNIHKRS